MSNAINSGNKGGLLRRLVYYTRHPPQKGMGNRLRFLTQQVLQSAFAAACTGRYSFIVPQAQRFYTPWYTPEFRAQVFEPIQGMTLLREDSCYIVRQLADHARHLPGDFAECGVYRGGSAHVIAQTLAAAGSKAHFHLFDTFGGMPATASAAHDGHREGDLADTSVETVKRFLSGFPNVHFHPGFIPDTFRDLPEKKWSFVHVDVDIYRSTVDSLEYFYPRVSPGGVFLFDDYGYRIHEHAEKRAVDEFFSTRPEKPIALQTGQAFVLKV